MLPLMNNIFNIFIIKSIIKKSIKLNNNKLNNNKLHYSDVLKLSNSKVKYGEQYETIDIFNK